ncbi:MAG: hypothetical protein HUJ75_06605 [Parasporobacterium sp.]|nr:hypothetical protein [Parasporobacterium sp.]
MISALCASQAQADYVGGSLASNSASTTFTAKSVRNMDLGEPYKKGTLLYIPAVEDFQVYKALIGPKPQPGQKDERKEFEFMYVECQKADDTGTPSATKSVVQLFPDMLAKVAFECNEAGDLTGTRVKTSGTASAAYVAGGNVQSGMAALAGKTIRIAGVQPVLVNKFGSKETRTTYIYQYDLV